MTKKNKNTKLKSFSKKTTYGDELLSEIESTIMIDQPYLAISNCKDNILVKGKYLLKPTEAEDLSLGKLCEFDVEIKVPRNFPESEPVVKETGIKLTEDDPKRHINKDGICCVCVYEYWYLNNTETKNFKSYFEKPFRNYFLGRYYLNKNDKWPLEEEKHGLEGLLDAYSELISCKSSKKEVLNFLNILSFKELKGHHDCPCGSGKKVRKCCFEKLHIAKEKINTNWAKIMIKKIKLN